MISVDVMAGETIDWAIAAAITMANDHDEPVQFEFNGIGLVAEPGANPSLLLQFWHSDMDRVATAYQTSHKGRRAAAEANQRRLSDQQVVDALVVALPNLDLSDFGAVIDWMECLADPADHIGVVFERASVLATFTEHGYERSVNTGADFNGDDRENFARYLIGQGLDGLATMGAPHPIFHKFANEWRSKFEQVES